jgi:Protein of unknown function (DUF4236)/zinc-ribbon domain
MGFYLRKRIKIAKGVNVNLSRSGIGLSVGVKGFRVSSGPRGTYLNAGRKGLYYRTKIGGTTSRGTSASRQAVQAIVPQVPAAGSTAHCPQCGMSYAPGVNFCGHCGAPVAGLAQHAALASANLVASPNLPLLPSYSRRAWAVTLLYLLGWLPGAIASVIWWWQYRRDYKATGLRPDGSRWLAVQFWCFTVLPVVYVVIAAISTR